MILFFFGSFKGKLTHFTASVFIKSISPDRMKIKLVLIDSCPTVTPLKTPCFVDPTLTHLNRWRYSPTLASKQIETVFSE